MELIYKCVFMILISKIPEAKGVSFTIMDSLYTNLTSSHNKYLRPEVDLDTTTTITLDFYIINLQDIDELEGTVSMTGYFVAKWTDQNIQWNPADFGGAYKIVLPYDKIWRPPLINANTAVNLKMFGNSDSYIYVLYTGDIIWYPGENLKFSCNIDTSYFPFDTQTCGMQIVSWGYGQGDINLTTTYTSVQLESHTENSEWDLSKSQVTVDSTMVTYYFYYKRRPLFLIINLILPVVFLALLNICVFCLPQDSGERIGFSITLLLAVVVFLTIAQGMLPATAKPRLSAVCIMLLIDLSMSGLILVSVIVSSWFYYKSDDDIVPSWIEKMVRLTCLGCKRKQNKIVDVGLERLKKPLDAEDLPQTADNIKSEKKITWQEVAKAWDTFSVIFYVLMFIGGILSFIIDISRGMK